MDKFTELLPETKSEKHGGLTWEPAEGNATSPFAGVLTIGGKRSWCRYRVEEFPADHGRGFMLFKLDAGTDRTEERYAVQCSRHGNACECRGFAYAGHCKHLAALVTLIENARL